MLTKLFIENLDIVFFIYGLSFVVMGMAILLQPRRGSFFRLADIIWLLAAFGLIHGLNEWLDMFALIKGAHSDLFNTMRLTILTISFGFLFEFGRRLICLSYKKFLNKWVTLFFCSLVLVLICLLKYDRSIWPRYFLGLPGGLFAAFGFIFYYNTNKSILKPIVHFRYFVTVSVAMGIYGIITGIVTPPANFFPASVINNSSFLNLFGIPVQVFRAICAVLSAWSIWNILRIFNWEIRQKLENNLEKLQLVHAKLKETQGQLIQAEKINAIGQLASGVAHEVKNPLAIIMQGINYLEDKISPEQKDIYEILGMIKDSIKRADNIIQSLLEFSRARALSLEPCDINSVLESALNLLRQSLKFDHIEIIKDIKKDILKVSVDKNKMEQVFINLLLNAIQAMPAGGRIIIRSYDTQLEETKNGVGKRKEDSFGVGEKAVLVEIEDTGEGISEENLKRIFDPFFTTKGPKEGTGLGLSVTRNIIIMHKGLIEAKSQVGKGTKVTITLKIA
jgi:signal transduction histidine kinase